MIEKILVQQMRIIKSLLQQFGQCNKNVETDLQTIGKHLFGNENIKIALIDCW